MRIGFVTTSFPRRDGDPAGSFVLGLARALARRGHDLEVVVPEPAEPADWEGAAPWRSGVHVFGAPYARPRALQRLFFGAGVPDNLAQEPWKAALIPTAVAGIYRTTRRRIERWDAVISHWLLPSALVVGTANRRRRIPHLAVAHSGDVNLLGRLPLPGRLGARVLGAADRIGFVSDDLRREFRGLLEPGLAEREVGRLVLAPQGVELADLAPPTAPAATRRRLDLGAGCVALFLGRLVRIKGLDVAIRALAGRPDTVLLVAGGGPEREALRRLARERSVDTRFCGWVDPAQRADLLAACDMLLLPSRVVDGGRHEGLPLTAIEGLAAGIPIIASATGGIGELIDDDETGLLIPADDPPALRAAIDRLASDHALADRLAHAGKAVAAGRDWSRLVELYEALLTGSRGRSDRADA